MKRVAIAAVAIFGALLCYSRPPSSEPAQDGVGANLPSPWMPQRGEAVSGATLAMVPKPPVNGELAALRLAFEKYEGWGDVVYAREQSFLDRLNYDPLFLTQAVECLKAEPNSQFIVYLGFLIARNSSEARNRVSQLAITLIAGDESPERRRAALALIACFPAEMALLDVAGSSAQYDPDIAVRASAVDALGAWLCRPEMSIEIDQASKSELTSELVQAINTSAEEGIGSRGLRALALQDARLPAGVFGALPRLFDGDLDSQDRVLVAAVLGLAADDAREFAVQRLERAYSRETDAEVKRFVAINLICLGGSGAVARLSQISDSDRLLIQQLLAELRTAPNPSQ